MSRRLLFALLAMGIAQAAVYLIRPTTSYRLLALGEGAREVGLVAAAFALLPIFLAIPLGKLSDRRGTPLLLIGCVVQVAGCLLLAASTATIAIAGSSAIVGLGHLALALGRGVVCTHGIEQIEDDHRAIGEFLAAIPFNRFVIGIDVVNPAEGREQWMTFVDHHAFDMMPAAIAGRVRHGRL